MYSYQAEVENSLSLPDFSFIKTCSYIYAAQKDCKFCSNGTPILKLAVHSFWFSGTRFLLKTVRFSFIIVM